MISRVDILVAEPSESVRELISFALKTMGFRVVEAADGREALEKAQETLFDLVIVSQELPHLNTEELIGRLRSQKKLSRIPILMVPGSSSHRGRKSPLTCAQTWIREPVGYEQVITAVRNTLE